MTGKGFDISAIVSKEKLQVAVPFNDEVTVTINYISREDQSALLKKATKKTWDRKHQPVEEFDHLLYGELLGEAAVANWNGLVVSGEPLPCTKENITLLMRKWADFAKFVSDTCTDLERLVAAQQEAAAKN